MNLTRCANGHFFDEDKYQSCPHCGAADRNDGQTVPLDRDDAVTMSVTGAGAGVNQAAAALNAAPFDAMAAQAQAATPAMTIPATAHPDSLAQAVSAVRVSAVGDDSPTIGYFQSAIGSEPVVGWLVCTEGNHRGEDFRLRSGRNFIGRAANMDVAITGDGSVARDRHAVVVYEPKSFTFLVQAGESKELCYLNDKVVLSAEELKSNDILSVGDTKLMFFPCCSKNFHWQMDEEPAKSE